MYRRRATDEQKHLVQKNEWGGGGYPVFELLGLGVFYLLLAATV